MGPSQFPELNALKAQAIAARTYAVAHLGDHADESWDLCDTPACQVYGGFDAEHRLSDRAVRESAGLIAVYGGEPIDAMYTSTCGGHTEDAVELFESRDRPYLRGVPCAWERELKLQGTGPEGDWVDGIEFSAAAARRVLALDAGASPADILQAASVLLGGRVGTPAGLDLESYSRALLETAALQAPAGIAPPTAALDRLLFLADLYGAPLDPPLAGLTGSWAAAAALAALQLHGDVLRDSGEAVPRPGGTGIFPGRARHSQPLPSQLPLWERWHGAYRSRSRAAVLPGTPLERVRAGDRVVALAYVSSGGAGEADRRSAWREWVRTRSWSELEVMLGVGELQRLTVTRRSRSGRVVGLEAVSSTGNSASWQGFDVREALELPETLFTMQLRDSPDGGKEIRFLGRGWGHGVGLCQHGAYGLARVGMDFERILKHYYSGIEIVRWPGSSGR
jgi:stage II sporulation protein D